MKISILGTGMVAGIHFHVCLLGTIAQSLSNKPIDTHPGSVIHSFWY